jgi:hypothetical protein
VTQNVTSRKSRALCYWRAFFKLFQKEVVPQMFGVIKWLLESGWCNDQEEIDNYCCCEEYCFCAKDKSSAEIIHRKTSLKNHFTAAVVYEVPQQASAMN